MEQKLLNITYKRDIRRLPDNSYGILTSIHIDEVLPSGKTKLFRDSCSYALRQKMNISLNTKRKARWKRKAA